jgi:ATP-dependent exoDNAse (exonuclease V) alpha subunit
MALFRLQINPISRAAGRSAPAAAAYRAGERIRDERTGVLHNYSRRRDVSHVEIFLPGTLAPGEAEWARDRARLWNAAEAAEQRRNSRVAREYQVSLPPELTAEQRLKLARGFCRELADRHNVAVDLAIHAPRAGGDPRNHHAHLLTTTREISAAGLEGKAGLDMAYSERSRRGLAAGLHEMVAIRERWATLNNEALRAAGLDVRVDHRSLQAQGIDREPLPSIPFVAYQMERRGLRSEVAERIRERYRARVAARAERQASADSVQTGDPAQAALPLLREVSGLEELRRRAREAWLQLRREALQPSEPRQKVADQAASAAEASNDSAEKDFCL